MDRRSFIISLIGGVAAAAVGGIAVAEAAAVKPAALPEPGAGAGLASQTVEALDKADAEFSRYYYRRRRTYYRRSYRRRRRW